MIELNQGWEFGSTPNGTVTHPSDFPQNKIEWLPAVVPGTVAQSLQALQRWNFANTIDFDAADWWYRTKFSLSTPLPKQSYLQFDGLATLAEVFLNGTSILISNNMFTRHTIDVSTWLQQDNELVIVFRSLNVELSKRRPRPKWKTKLVNQQQLRWIRTSLLGRMPGWSPPVAAVGPWKSGRLCSSPLSVLEATTYPRLEKEDGVTTFFCKVTTDDSANTSATASINHQTIKLNKKVDGNVVEFSGDIAIANVERWWPQPYGAQTLYDVQLTVENQHAKIAADLPPVGFRLVQADTSSDGFSLVINGRKIFCRGAVWTVNDIVSLTGNQQSLEIALTLARNAGINMLRLSGTMIYEQESFYRLCDQYGIMVWQDFMFANMDYPFDDPEFRTNVTREIEQVVGAARAHACIATYCGNSEIEQQAAMLGMPKELWRNPLFGEHIPNICTRLHPGIPYVASSPSGGTLPFHAATGVTHYYGVGAYQRPILEARRANVKFASECLAFANVPEPETILEMTSGQFAVTHHPLWKQRLPRDNGSGWDFEDVRDFYFRELYGVDPIAFRYADSQRYLALSRTVSAEVMTQVFSEWRRRGSPTAGALIWFYKDLWPGAGWGVVDSENRPKACYYALRRVWQPRCVVLTNEVTDGIHAHVINESDAPLSGKLELTLLKDNHVVTAHGSKDISIEPWNTATFESDDVLGSFFDVAYSYRFGPIKHHVVAASLHIDGSASSEAFLFPVAGIPMMNEHANVVATAQRVDDNHYVLNIQCDRFLQSARLDCPGFLAEDNYFHLLPGRNKTVHVSRIPNYTKSFSCFIEAANLTDSVKVTVK